MKKILQIFLYNFFVFFIFYFIFSTNNVQANTYKIGNIEISEEYNTNFNKDNIIDKAFNSAFQTLIRKITLSKNFPLLENQNIKLIKSFVESFSVVNEKFENNKYHGVFEINFNKKKILSFLRNKNIFHARMIEKKILFIPVFINLEKNTLLLFDENPFYSNWNINMENQFLIKYILQNEDLDDYKLIKEQINTIENYDFKEITSKYELNENYIIFIAFKDNEGLKTFSKLNINDAKINIKEEFKGFKIKNKNKIETIIKFMKVKYDDELKKINLINSSIKLNIQLNLNSKDTSLINKIENILNKIELIESYYINNFDNKITSYSILSNSTPDKLIKEFDKYNIDVTPENNIWFLNE